MVGVTSTPREWGVAVTPGSGIGLLPEWLVTEQVRSKALRVVLPGW
jgi:hypothetical protein